MSGVSYMFPCAGRSYGTGSGLKIDGFINSKDEINSLDVILTAVFPKSTADFRSNVIKNMACGAYTREAITPEINATMLKLMRYLREEPVRTKEEQKTRKWFNDELAKANPGKNIEDIFQEVCNIRHEFVKGLRDTYPYENPILPRISRTLYFWDYFSTFVSTPIMDNTTTPALTEIGKKIRKNQNISLEEVNILLKKALQEKEAILSSPEGKTTYPTRLSKIEEFLKTIQGITLLTPEQLLAAE